MRSVFPAFRCMLLISAKETVPPGDTPWLSLRESCHRRWLRGSCRLFRMSFGIVIVCPLRPRYARPPLPKGEARDARAVHRKVYRNALFISSANWSLPLNGDKLDKLHRVVLVTEIGFFRFRIVYSRFFRTSQVKAFCLPAGGKTARLSPFYGLSARSMTRFCGCKPGLLEHMNGVGENTSKNACISCLKIHIKCGIFILERCIW